MPGVWKDAWFEDQMDDGPIYIVIKRAAANEELAAFGRRFGVSLFTLTAFRDALPA